MRGLTIDHPGLGNDIGMAASPVTADGVVVVQCECQTVSFASGLDAATGKTRWEVNRPESSNWCSPAIVRSEGGAAVMLQAGAGLQLRAVASGDVLWEGAKDGATISSPAAIGGFIVAPSDGLTALRRTADGIELAWNQSAAKPGSPSPVAYAGKAFVINRGGILSAVDLETGERISSFKKRLGGTYWATPLAADGRLYCVNQEGVCSVVDIEAGGEVVSKVDFGEDIYGSPAAADGGMFVRSNGKLWKVAATRQALSPHCARQLSSETPGSSRRQPHCEVVDAAAQLATSSW